MADKAEPLDAVERIVKIVKELSLLALIGYLAWYLVPFVPKWTARLDTAQIAEINIAGFGVKLAQTVQELKQAVKTSAPQTTARDEGVSPEKKVLVDALESVQALRAEVVLPPTIVPTPTQSTKTPEATKGGQIQQTFWVYLGIATGDLLPSRNFRLSKVPVVGEVIVALTEVYKRATAPIEKSDGWYLGNTTGVVRTGQRVLVRNLQKIESTQAGSQVLWAEVEATQ